MLRVGQRQHRTYPASSYPLGQLLPDGLHFSVLVRLLLMEPLGWSLPLNILLPELMYGSSIIFLLGGMGHIGSGHVRWMVDVLNLIDHFLLVLLLIDHFLLVLLLIDHFLLLLITAITGHTTTPITRLFTILTLDTLISVDFPVQILIQHRPSTSDPIDGSINVPLH
jgi:hypothetical protein